MVDAEIERLRRLRGAALRMRAVALALDDVGSPDRDRALLQRGACAAWRISRAVSGRLRAHPYERFRKDAGLGVVLTNSLAAALAAFASRSPRLALAKVEGQLKRLARELDHARALTWTAELSDSFGRSQTEIRLLMAEFECQTRTPAGARASGGDRRSESLASIGPRDTRASGYVATDTDWPFLAF
ncbi:MAG: hypothetical protein JWN43_1250 [Gammaproteobacteria bacterium]|nr:hypothetical protein [Gammaproteobacteria bacterium]